MLNVYCLDSATPRLFASYDFSAEVATRPERIDLPDIPCWLDLFAPAPDELALVCRTLDIPSDFLTDSLDPSERPHISQDEGSLLAITQVSVPTEDWDDCSEDETPYRTVPLGLVFRKDVVVSVCLRAGLAAAWGSRFHSVPPSEGLKEAAQRNVTVAGPEGMEGAAPVLLQPTVTAPGAGGSGAVPQKGVAPLQVRPTVMLAFTLLQQSCIAYVKHLQNLEKMAESVEFSMRRSMRNAELSRMMQLQKTLVYFMTALKANAPVMEKLYNLPCYPLNEDEGELLLDGLRECRQAAEMGGVYSQIISSMSDTFAAMISNNVNAVMKFLTAVTLVLMAPSAIFSLYGMNVPLPLQDSPEAIVVIVGVTVVICVGLWRFLIKRHWM